MSAASSRNPIQIPGFGAAVPGSADDARLGALLGMAVGDALGTTYEFERLEQAPYPTLATGPATDIVGGGPFDLVAGQVTDDTQMAVCIARSLLATTPSDRASIAAGTACPPSDRASVGGGTAPSARGSIAAHTASAPVSWFDRLDARDLATRYLDWYQHAFDVGNQTASSISAIESGDEIMSAGRRVWHASGRRAAGNGSLMRTTPLGVALAGCAIEQIIEGALTDSLLTHADPRCLLAVAVFDVAIAHAVMGSDRSDPISAHDAQLSGIAMADAARRALPIAASRMRELWSDDRDDLAALDSAKADLTRDLDAAVAEHPDVYSSELHVHRTAGFVRVAFRLAFWHLLHTSWRNAVVDVASRGGDADTNTAIVGALLGARDGVTAIPPAWIERVLGVTQPGPAEWADAHHPRHLVALAAALR